MEIEGRSKRASPFSVEEAVEECVISRRDFYVGLWAGRRLGLSEEALHDYARNVVEADCEEPGSEDVIRKLARDFAAHGCKVAREEIERQLCQMQAIAIRQFTMSD